MNSSSLDSRGHQAGLVERFARELSIYVGRSVGRLFRDGLRAGDFDGDVLVDFADGSTMTFLRAIVVLHKSKLIGIFTEHCGYYAFNPVDIRVSRVWDGRIFRRYGDLLEGEPSRTGRLKVSGREYVAIPSVAYSRLAKTEAMTDAIVFTRLAAARSLRAARRHAGLTRRGLAKRLRKPYKTVCKTELGRYQASVSYVRKVLAACGLPDEWRGHG